MHRNIRNKPYIKACLPLMLVASFTGLAAAAEDDEEKGWFIPKNTAAKNFYGGIGVGGNRSDAPDSNQDGSVSGLSTDKSGITSGVFLGYQATNNLAVEGGYRDLGESEFTGTASGAGSSWTIAGPVRTKQEADGWELGVMGRWPISQRWYALGYVGMYWWENKETYYESGFVSSIKENGNDITYALGFEFDHGLKDRIVYRFMGSHHEVGNDNYNVNTASAAVIYRFP
jgi:OOP family OmpA-OmpF porin